MPVARASPAPPLPEPPPFVAAPTCLRSSGCRFGRWKMSSPARGRRLIKGFARVGGPVVAASAGWDMIAVAATPTKTAVVSAFPPEAPRAKIRL